jgi:serum/glucocorticoid-regulated kinase 2
MGLKQERYLILTSMHVYNFKKKKVRRKINIREIGAIILSEKSTNELVLHVPKEYDYRYNLDTRKEFVDILKLRYANLESDLTLKIYSVAENLKIYTTTLNDKKYGLYKLPEESKRLRDEEIAGSRQMEEEKELERKLELAQKELEAHMITDDKDDNTISDIFELSNSRDSEGGSFQVDLVNDEDEDFDIDELKEHGSLLLFASMTAECKITLDDFDIISILGKGAFGKVYLTKMKENGQLYAIKTIRKDVVIETDQIDAVNLERDILLNCDHPFLVGMDFVFQSDLRLYFVMQFVEGGELYKHFLSNKRFPEEIVKFYAVQIVLSIGHLHTQGIIHRDLKLENILIDKGGYLKIIDFGLAKILKEDETTKTLCGTPEYLAPEMITQGGHDKNVDWWALGVLIYEMLIGVTPFYNRNRAVMMSKIQKSKIVFPHKKKYNIEYSDEVKEIICLLLAKKKERRLGSKNGAAEILEHPWFKVIDTTHILERNIKPPFIPDIAKGEEDKYYSHNKDKFNMHETYIPKPTVDVVEKYQDKFEGFDKGKNKKLD